MPIVATVVLLLLHVPPGNVFPNEVLEPAQTTGVPLMADGSGFMVTVVVAIQFKGEVYMAIALPADIPVNTPVAALIVAMAVLLLVQVPPDVASLSVVMAPLHIDILPVMAAGSGFTVAVTVVDVAQPADVI